MTAIDQALERYAPDAARKLAAARDQVGKSDARLTELARLRIAMLLGAPDVPASSVLTAAEVADLRRWPYSERFDGTDRAALALAEQFVIDVSGVTDADVAALAEAVGPGRLYGFVQSLWVIDMSTRLELALGAALLEEP